MKDRTKVKKCDVCGRKTIPIIGLPVANPGWDKEKKYTNFESKPITFASRGEMRKYCKERNLHSGAID